MNYKLIMLPQPILVSDEEVNPHNAVWDFENNQVTVLRQSYGLTNYKKIVAGLPDLPKLDLSLIADEIGWVDVEKLAYQAAEKSFKRGINKWENKGIVKFFIDTYIEGFKAAQSLNEKKYSEEDLFNLLKMVHDKRLDSLSARIVDNGRVTDFNFWNSYSKKQVYASELISEFIQSLPKPKEFFVELEMEVNQCDGCISGHHIIDGIHKAPYPSGSMVCKKHLYDRPKITNNTIKVTKLL